MRTSYYNLRRKPRGRQAVSLSTARKGREEMTRNKSHASEIGSMKVSHLAAGSRTAGKRVLERARRPTALVNI